jgi:hypothetical protein
MYFVVLGNYLIFYIVGGFKFFIIVKFPISGFGKNQNQRITNFSYFKNIKEKTIFMKALVVIKVIF